jgi:hypothetical protein
MIGLAVATLAWLLSVIAGHHSMLTRAARATVGWRGESRLPFGCPSIRQRLSGVNLQLAGGNDMKPPDDHVDFSVACKRQAG